MPQKIIEDIVRQLYLDEEETRHTQPPKFEEVDFLEAEKEGFIKKEGSRYLLTTKGRELAIRLIRCHRLIECLLKDVLGTKNELEEDACNIEHLLNSNLEERVCVLLGHPQKCPHGYPIPEGECCRIARSSLLNEVVSLCDIFPNQEGIVAYLQPTDQQDMRKFLAMGLLPGTRLRLEQRFPAYIFQIGHSRFVIDKELAQAVKVYILQPNH